jgi:hypothetical protein
VARLAADVHELLVGLDLRDVTAVGTSLGAALLWCYQELFAGERLGGMVRRLWRGGGGACSSAGPGLRVQGGAGPGVGRGPGPCDGCRGRIPLPSPSYCMRPYW